MPYAFGDDNMGAAISDMNELHEDVNQKFDNLELGTNMQFTDEEI
jgi:hypothetical protein